MPDGTRSGHIPDGTYPPLHTLKPVAENVWLVDGPIIHFGPKLLKSPFPTHMTIVRLRGAELFVHSPTELSPALREQVERLGTPRWIVAPSRIHYWWFPPWHSAFPNAEVYVAPRVRTQAARIDFPCTALNRDSGLPWSGEIDTLLVAGRYLTEAEFFHRPSRTLILTDLIENFEPAKLNWPRRLLARLGGIISPDGSMPRDMRLMFSGQVLRDAVEKLLAWNPERVIIAHGRWFDRDGRARAAPSFPLAPRLGPRSPLLPASQTLGSLARREVLRASQQTRDIARGSRFADLSTLCRWGHWRHHYPRAGACAAGVGSCRLVVPT